MKQKHKIMCGPCCILSLSTLF